MTTATFEEIKDGKYSIWDGISEKALLGGKISSSAKFEPYVVIEDNVEIGTNTIIGPHTFLRSGTKIGDNTTIGGCCVLEGNLEVGNHVRIGTHCNLGWGTKIENCVFIAGHLTGANDHDMVYLRKQFKSNPYTIRYGARIGLHVVIGAGVIVGKNSMVGMGSVVTRNVMKYFMGIQQREHE